MAIGRGLVRPKEGLTSIRRPERDWAALVRLEDELDEDSREGGAFDPRLATDVPLGDNRDEVLPPRSQTSSRW